VNFQLLKYLTDFNEPWYERYAIESHPVAVLSFLSAFGEL
jgi:hypothetical protein